MSCVFLSWSLELFALHPPVQFAMADRIESARATQLRSSVSFLFSPFLLSPFFLFGPLARASRCILHPFEEFMAEAIGTASRGGGGGLQAFF